MTRYHLPDRFGGEEVRLVPNGGLPNDMVMVEAAGGALFAFSRGFIRCTEPPAEPEDGYVGLDGATIWQRDDTPENRFPNASRVSAGEHWWRVGDDQAYTWKRVCEKTDPAKWIRLIEDPAERLKLSWPWSIDPDGIHASVNVHNGAVYVWCGNAVSDEAEELDPDDAVKFAHAILRAAREAGQQ